jgi:peptidyl-prolyl cis-trans isomerase A (cyclophilin A)
MRCLLSLGLLVGCGSPNPNSVQASTPVPATVPATVETPKVETPAAAAAVYKIEVETTKGKFVVAVHPDWAPNGAARLKELVSGGFFEKCKFFRVIEGFMVQFGISGDPAVAAKWKEASIPDDKVTQSNTRGRVTFATRGPNTRTTQLFINFGDNANLDRMGFSPVGEVIEGMDVVDALYNGYGEGAPRGRGPDQGRMQNEGNGYLEKEFPKLDGIIRMSLVE